MPEIKSPGKSIKRQLIASVLIVELAVALCGTAMAFFYERHAHFRAFDILLRGRADSLLGAVQDAGDEADSIMLDGTQSSLPERDIYAVWDEDLRLLGHSRRWTMMPDAMEPQRPYAVIEVAGRQYRTIRLVGARVVDPGDKGGGKLRRVTIVYGSSTHPVWQAVWRAVAFYGATSLGLAIATGLAMFWLLRRGLAPLEELAAQAGAVSVQSWEFLPSERVCDTEELAPLANALKTALQGLETSFTQQRQFIGDAAHELKTAVAVVKSSLQLLTMKPRAAGEYQAGLDRLQDDCGRMEEIVAKMLTLARIEGRPVADNVSVEATAVDAALQRVREQLASFAEIRRVSITTSVTPGLLARIVPAELDLLGTNLMMNALQHSEAGDTVRMTATTSGDWIEVLVSDEGVGIAAASLPYVFDRFYRSDPSRTRHTGGTGLGLAICKAIVLRCGGTIDIASTIGVGTTVTVRLAAVQAELPFDGRLESVAT